MTRTPPARFGREHLVRISEQVLAKPEAEIAGHEEILAVEAGDLEWDAVAIAREPKDPQRVSLAPDVRRSASRCPIAESLTGARGGHPARLIARKRGAKVVNMTFPETVLRNATSRVVRSGRGAGAWEPKC